MNTNDLPPAAKLAALIEAGRAAHPEITQCVGIRIRSNNRQCCALGFAQLGDGFPARYEALHGMEGFRWLDKWPEGLREAVADMNNDGATLDEIVHSLREGKLATASTR